LRQNFVKMASLAKRPKADSATAADAPRPVGTEEARLEELRQVYARTSSRDEFEALLNEDVQQCVITGNYKRNMLERYLKTWFLHPDKHVASEVR
jgi:hypothetical protein